MRPSPSDSEIEILASAIARQLALPTQANPSVSHGWIESMASAISRRLASRALTTSPAHLDVESMAGAVVQRLASPVRHNATSLASAIVNRVASPSRSFAGSAVSPSQIDAEVLASQVAKRLSAAKDPATPQEFADHLASVIAGLLKQPTFSLPPGDSEQLVSRLASTISRRLASQGEPASSLPSDRVDALQAIKSEEQKVKKDQKQ
jgi:hypothetical protein